jgi:uncharacterized protein
MAVLPDSTPRVPDPEPSTPSPSLWVPRLLALIEVLICSDFPTQLALSSTLAAVGIVPFDRAGHLQMPYVVGLSLLDTPLLIGLVVLFLHAHGERARDVIFGRRPIAAEVAYGLPLILVALGLGMAVLLAVQHFAPTLHTVGQNPLESLLGSRANQWLFALVVIAAGGVREEVQRAFVLHRFEVWLGGGTIGVVVSSVAFGAGHLLQGLDAAIVTGLLGAFWGVIYLRRRSAVAPMVSHAGFDLLEILQFVAVGR